MWLKRTIIGLVTAAMLVPGVSTQAAEGKFNMSYLYFGSTSTYVDSVDRTKNSLHVVSPDFFNLNTDGTLKLTTKLSTSFITEMHKRGVKVVPFLSNHWDRELGRKALQNREQLATQLADAMQKYNLDGVNVDLENLNEADRANYVDLVRLLRAKLPAQKEVSVAVAANPRGFQIGWHGSYDYKKLSDYSDYLMVMAYDENYSGDTTAGPVASDSFVKGSIQYALDQGVPRNKIVLGIPFFGRVWKSDGTMNGAGVSNSRVPELLAKYGGRVVYDAATKSAKATFTVKPTDEVLVIGSTRFTAGTYTLWFENETSIKEKLRLVEKYQLKGTGSWSLTQEADGTWDYYSRWLNGRYFEDTENHWAGNDILAMLDKGWMVGTAPLKFSPEKPLTRAQAAVILVKALGLEEQSAPSAGFRDVPANHWAKRHIDIAKQAGFISGLEYNLFAPEQNVSRQEMASMLARLLKIETQPSVGAPFVDVTDGWSFEAILAMKQEGILSGYEGGYFRPLAGTTRAEMASLMNRIAERLTTLP
ncbi:glycosyl hydrolase family 18 protein [Tumebacillus lipolyticus]|uniref:Glycosyl hydrolase family 18 protein n=1 Tax=Tumebacillus lipolyticus TaxID=1280370 RepID=A0ABW4ZSV4_9BACL